MSMMYRIYLTAWLRTQLLRDGQRLKETYSAGHNSILLNFGSQINNNTNSPAHAIGNVSGTSWNLITSDKTSGVVTSAGSSTDLQIDLGKSMPGEKTISWNRHGFVNSSLGVDYNVGVYADNARSATFVNDGKGSRVSLGVRYCRFR